MNNKVIVLGDIHFGIKKFSLSVLESQLRFFELQLIPFMKENEISTIYQLGDLFDNRTMMDINFYETIKQSFFNMLYDNDIQLHVLTGNHDIYFKNTRNVNILTGLQELYSNIHIYNDQSIVPHNELKIGMVPFLVPGEHIEKYILDESDYIFGHFECSGFEIANGIIDKHSNLTSEFFQQFSNIKNVLSGHYHIPNTSKFVKYVGTPYQMSWGDSGHKHGFYTLDVITNTLEFYPNTSSIRYVKIYVDGNVENAVIIDDNVVMLDQLSEQVSVYDEVKLIIQNLASDEAYTHVIDILTGLAGLSVNNIQVIDNRETVFEVNEKAITNLTLNQEQTAEISRDTLTFIQNYIKNDFPDLLLALQDILTEETKDKSDK